MRHNPVMRILGIETSCDETAVCLIEATGDFGPSFQWKALGNALISQAAMHAEFGGVFPNLAKREHAKHLVPLLEQALKEGGQLIVSSEQKNASSVHLPLGTEHLRNVLEREPELLAQLIPFLKHRGKPDIDAIAVTYGPGLEPALWVGINFAKALSLVWDVPIVAVNHMEGHIVLSMMQSEHLAGFEFPVLALLISGGHTELVLSKQFQSYEIVGETRDDAAGEAFDKVARLLGLEYPGGPEISRLAAASRLQELPLHPPALPRPMLHEDNFDFSFSGLKTAVRRLVEAGELSDEKRMGIAREFEEAVADVLVGKTLRAVEEFGASTVVVGGGVSANAYIRERLAKALEKDGGLAKLLIPPPKLATDNALMIALAGYFHACKKEFSDAAQLQANGNLTLNT